MNKTNYLNSFRAKGFSAIAAVIIAVVALAAIGGGVWYYQAKTKPITPAQNSVSQQNTPQTRDETAGWKTYRNEKYGFEVKYPPNWSFSDRLNDFRYMGISFWPTSFTQARDIRDIMSSYPQERDITFSCQSDNYSEDNFTASGEGNNIELVIKS